MIEKNSISDNKKVKFILQIGKSLHESGIPTHLLENKLENLCTKFGLQSDFFLTPGSIFASIKEEGVFNAHLVKVRYSELNLNKIDSIEKLISRLVNQKINFDEAILELQAINKKSNPYSNWMMILFFAISTGSAAAVFGGKYPEIMSSFVIGLGIGSLFSLAQYLPNISKILVVIASFWAFIVAHFFSFYFVDFKQDLSIICGLIILIPGFSFTLSITEMVNNHLVAGLSRFTSVFITFVMIAMGILLGSQILSNIQIETRQISIENFPMWFKYLALIFVPLGFVVLFKSKFKDFIWIALACWCSYFCFQLSLFWFNPIVSVFISSFILGIFSKLFVLFLNRNDSLILVPGMILLVPGSLGFFSLSQIIESDILAGIETALEMLTTSMSLVFGLIFSKVFFKQEN